MKTIFNTVTFLSVIFWAASTQAVTDSQQQAISDIGRLNGIALQCRYIDQVRKIKMALVESLPKQRMLGEWFEQSTSTSFMLFMEKDMVCPVAQSFHQEVDEAIKKIKSEFIQ